MVRYPFEVGHPLMVSNSGSDPHPKTTTFQPAAHERYQPNHGGRNGSSMAEQNVNRDQWETFEMLEVASSEHACTLLSMRT